MPNQIPGPLELLVTPKPGVPWRLASEGRDLPGFDIPRSGGDVRADRPPPTHPPMKTLPLLVSLLALTLLPLRAGEAWLTDHAKALEKAKAENKPVVMDFTGSDWCGWCIKLDKEVFDTPSFQAYAQKNLVLLKLDFPRKRSIPASEKKQNEELAAKYGIRGFPTIVVLNSEGTQVGQLGYRPGGPGPWIAELEKFTKKP